MAQSRKVVQPGSPSKKNTIADRVSAPNKNEKLIVDFSKFKLASITLRGIFNNHFKDERHFATVTSVFLGTVLPKVMSHTYSEICEGGNEGRVLHFHTIDENHCETVRDVLEEYHFPRSVIEQMLEGNSIVEFTAALGHVYAARVVCHKVQNTLYLLFFDTNHHIYLNESFVRESMFYDECPTYLSGSCNYMPTECFAAGCLDEKLLRDSYGYSFAP